MSLALFAQQMDELKLRRLDLSMLKEVEYKSGGAARIVLRDSPVAQANGAAAEQFLSALKKAGRDD